jgi:phage gp46-like protein
VSDLALRWDVTALAADLAVEANDLARGDGLETAVLLSLFCDRRADEGDVIPDGQTERRGWWADALPVIDGDRIGSRLWLLARETERATVISRVEQYAAEALRWLIDDRVAERVEVAAEFPRRGMRALAVTIHRPRVDPVTYRFAETWRAQGA